ncbi:unnamed protein product [Acanthoscelides obtectus]|uniref:beta-glucosidase n=1 Tax=Acanthoscelides obtectus TaxID=200917 RepID=A0A9P0JPL7_ACAOB|nr:unnamed protein product [Acanthoscelides obtectus]CAK1621199.1 Lactase-phlorizin hydrolase [Acanthoscelides obtectus]
MLLISSQNTAEKGHNSYFLPQYGLYGHPIYYGDWPEIVKDRVALRSYGEGLEVSRLPEFTPEEKELIKGTHDYLTINYYATHMANATGEAPFDRRSTYDDMNIIEWLNPAWPKGGPDWFSIWPMGLRKVLNWLKETYGDHEIVITENGLSDNTGDIQDPHRIQYIRCGHASFYYSLSLISIPGKRKPIVKNELTLHTDILSAKYL